MRDLERACAIDSNRCTQTKLFFDDWVNSLPQLVRAHPELVCCMENWGAQGCESYKVKVKITNAVLGTPCVVNSNGDVDNSLTPTRCRLESLTYAAPLYFDIAVVSEEPGSQGAEYSGTSSTVYIGNIPVLVGCSLSRQGGYSSAEEVDDGGYFILKGKERIIPLYRSSDNYSIVCYDAKSQNATTLAIRRGNNAKGKSQSTRISKTPGTPASFKFWGAQQFLGCAEKSSERPASKRRRPNKKPLEKAIATPGVVLSCLGVENPNAVFEELPEEDAVFLGKESFAAPSATGSPQNTRGLFPETSETLKSAATVNALRMISFMKRTDFLTERDSVLSQTVEGVREMLTAVFERALRSSMSLLKTRLETRLRKIHELRTDNKNHRASTLSMPDAKYVGKQLFRFNCVVTRMLYFVGTGNLVPSGENSALRVGMCQLLERTSHLQKQSGMNKVVSSLDPQNAPSSAREFMLCSLGRLCPVSTPEGKRTGLVGQKALGASVSRDRFSCVGALHSCIEHLLCDATGPGGALTAATTTGVWFSGQFRGLTRKPYEVAAALRKARREGQLPRDIGVSLHGTKHNVVFVEVRHHAGRLLRPLIPLDAYRPPLPLKTTWSQYIQEGFVEVIDAREESGAYVAAVETRATEEHTHREVFHAASLGACTATIPFLDHEPSPRAAYYTNQAQQSMGFDPRMYANRMSDSKIFQLYYPQKSLVNTSFEHSSGIENSAPQGVNVSVCVLSFQGCEEDAILLSRAAVERGLFLGAEYNVKTITTADRTKKCFAHPNATGNDPANPVNEFAAIKKEHHALDTRSGIARVGERLQTGDAIAGIATDYGVRAVNHIAALPATVDRVLVHEEPSGHRVAKVRLRTVRTLAVGDKIASRFSQKGIVGRLVDEEEMPWLEDGSGRIDMIINPCYIPSRMTVGQPAEAMLGYALASLGMSRGDASAFAHNTISVVEGLKAKGFRSFSKWLRCPITGERLGRANIGLVKYNRLNKYASDKCRVRTEGARDLISNQPCAGRNPGERALRVGGMETTALAAHGAAKVLDDASRDRSDGCTTLVCRNCGNTHVPTKDARCALCNEPAVQIASTTATVRMMQICDAMNVSMNLDT